MEKLHHLNQLLIKREAPVNNNGTIDNSLLRVVGKLWEAAFLFLRNVV